MSDILPDWSDPTAWVRDVTTRGLDARGAPGAMIAVFEDDEPTILLRPAWRSPRVLAGVVEALGIVALLGVRALVVVQPMSMSDPETMPDTDRRFVTLCTTGRRVEGEVEIAASIHAFDLGDHGVPTFREVEVVDEPSPMATEVRKVLLTPAVPVDDRVGLAYAADRFGHGVVVSSAWRQHYGFDRPLSGPMVRPVDRRRVRHQPRVRR